MTSNLTLRILSRILISLILLCTYLVSPSQEMIGITSSQYGGIQSAQLNPATMVLSPLYIDISIASVNAFVENNYLYMPGKEAKLSRFLKGGEPMVNTGPNKSYGDYYTNSLKYGQIQARITGPSAMVVAGKHAFGFSTAVRSMTTMRNMPHTLAKFFYEGLKFPPQYDTRYQHSDKISFSSLHWAEAGLSYSFLIKSDLQDVWAGGVTVKRLLGFAGAYADIDRLDYMIPDKDTLIIYNTTMDAGFSLPIDYNSNDLNTPEQVRGKGTGLDIGLTWERKLRTPTDATWFTSLCGQSYVPYLFRVGASLLDLGSIRFMENAKRLGVTDKGLFWPGIGGMQYSNLNDLTGQMSDHFYGDPTSMTKGDEFSMHLPTRISLQGDFNLSAIITGKTADNLSNNGSDRFSATGLLGWLGRGGSWYINGVAMLPVNRADASVTQPMLLAIGTRYESTHFQLGMTGSFYDNRYFHLGVNGRFRNIFIGTDNLLSFLKVADFTGTSLYAGIRISLRKGNCRERGFNCPDLF